MEANDDAGELVDELTPDDEERWCAEQRDAIRAHLTAERHAPGAIAEWPAWSVPGVVGIWAVQSAHQPQWIGWWAIAGDVPTDAVAAERIDDPREALRAIATRWLATGEQMQSAEVPPAVNVGSPDEWRELGAALLERAETLLEWADDDEMWEE
jgi:hypothetical protein